MAYNSLYVKLLSHMIHKCDKSFAYNAKYRKKIKVSTLHSQGNRITDL